MEKDEKDGPRRVSPLEEQARDLLIAHVHQHEKETHPDGDRCLHERVSVVAYIANTMGLDMDDLILVAALMARYKERTEKKSIDESLGVKVTANEFDRLHEEEFEW